MVRLGARGLSPHGRLPATRHRGGEVSDRRVEDGVHVGFADEGTRCGAVAEREVVEHLRNGRVGHTRIQIRARQIPLQRCVPRTLGDVSLQQIDCELGHPPRLRDGWKCSVGEFVSGVVRRPLVELVPRVAGTDPGDLVPDRGERRVDPADAPGHQRLGAVHRRSRGLDLLDIGLDQSVGVVDIEEVACAEEGDRTQCGQN